MPPSPGARRLTVRTTVLATLVAAGAVRPADAQQSGDDDKPPAITAYIYETTPRKPSTDFVRSLRVAPGYRVSVFASGLANARFLSVAPNGDVYVNRNSQADVIRLRDANRDGVADGPPEVVARHAGLLGMKVHGGRMYLATARELFVADLAADGTVGPERRLIKDLPDAGQHYTRHMQVGPDSMLYLGIGSTCNTCTESSPESAAILRISPDGTRRSILASGLRHTIGFDWHPRTGELWGWDQGIDWLGNDLQREELNRIESGKRYGWPYVMEDGKEYPQLEPQGGVTNAQWAAASTAPVLMHVAHSAGMQLAFHPGGGAMGAEVAGDAFVALRGSWNRKPASGYEVVRVRFDAQGRATRIEPFVSGFLSADGTSNYGRLCGLAVAADGALLFTDDTNGMIYRVARAEAGGATAAFTPARPPAEPMQRQASRGFGVPIAMQRPETQPASGSATSATLTVSSPAIVAGGAIPPMHSEYGQGVSLPLSWSAVPGARSYAIVMEDPDSKPAPFVHWTAWNVPASLTALPAGLPERDRLDGPGLEGIMQGATSRGSVGYYGPRPPAGDPPHRYHVQLFALDRMLELPLGATRDQLLAAMQGHVLARGEIVGSYQQQTPPEP